MKQASTSHPITKDVRDRVLQEIASPKGRELVATLVCVGDDIANAIEKLTYEYKYRCVVDDEMGPANSDSALDLSANLEQSLLEARRALEDATGGETTSR
ncbi:MAG TPA: hypothetical protein VJZ71_18125 [Phycisphaerae bacterium]|nr:hypothetical protein [Phycisphaerae bacterium]